MRREPPCERERSDVPAASLSPRRAAAVDRERDGRGRSDSTARGCRGDGPRGRPFAPPARPSVARSSARARRARTTRRCRTPPRSGSRNRTWRRSYESEYRVATIATGSVRAESTPKSGDHAGAPVSRSRLLVRATNRCRRDRTADDPATAMSVRTYGRAWNRTAAESEYSGSRCASALEKPKSRQAAAAPNGRQFPKMTAASAMKPRPALMFSLNESTNPIER